MNQTANEHQGDHKHDRLLPTLERLLRIEATELDVALNEAALLVAGALEAEKVDVFLHDPKVDTLIALGTSDTPLGRRQRALGLDRMPVVNGGYIVKVFLSGISYLTGHLEQEPDRVIGMTSSEGLGVRSEMVAGLEVNGTRRGVLMASSRTPDFFSEQDMHFLEAVSRWIGIVIQRTELVERLKKEAVQQNRRMLAEELLTVAAHNVRNYLTPLNVHVDLILMRAQHRKRIQDIHDTTVIKNLLHRLERLIDDLLDVARLDQGLFFLNEQPVKLARLVQETALAFKTPDNEIEVSTPQEVVIVGDAGRLSRVVENLLSNAITHARKKTPIIVRLSVEKREHESWAVLTVSNQGPKIPSELLPRLFQPFVKSAGSKGLGLGLYLASNIAAAHHGTLTVDAAREDGVQFSLALPIALDYGTEGEPEEEIP